MLRWGYGGVKERRVSIDLLIFGINYWPEPTGTALNTTGLAEGLAARGWRVRVVTGIPHYPSWRPLSAAPTETRNGVRISRYTHYVPSTQSAITRGAYEATWAASALRAFVDIERPDVILGVSPSLGGAALARLASFVYTRPYALLFQDLVGRAAEQSTIPGAALVAPTLDRVERWLAKDAAAVMVVAEGFADHFAAARVTRVRNPVRLGPVTASREETRRALGWRDGETIVLHTGAIGYKQDLERVLDAARLDDTVRFVFQGEGSRRADLERKARERELTHVTFRPLDPEDALPNTLAAADVLLLHQRAGVRNMSMPAKLGTYFAAGRPVIAVVEDDDEVAREVRAAGAGLVVPPGDARALVEAIGWLRWDREKAAAHGASGMAFAKRELSADAAVDAIGSTLADAARTVRSRDR